MRSDSRSFGVCLIRAVSLRCLRTLELRSPRAYRRFSSGVEIMRGLTLTGLRDASDAMVTLHRIAHNILSGTRVKGDHGHGAMDKDVLVLDCLSFPGCFRNLHCDLHATPSGGVSYFPGQL